MPEYRTGQIVPLRYKNREIKAIIIDPNGLGENKPTLGMGFRGMDRQIGIPQTTLSRRVMQIDGEKYLELPSGRTFRVMQIDAEDGNEYLLLEASDWAALAQDWAKNPGKLRKPARDGLLISLPGSLQRESTPRHTPSSSGSTPTKTTNGCRTGSCRGSRANPSALTGAGR